MSKFNFLKKIGIFGSIACILSGCVFDKTTNVPDEIYGPPEEIVEDEPDDSPDEAADEEATDTPDEVSDDANAETASPSLPETIEDGDEFTTGANINACIYGPPEMLAERASQRNE